MVTHCKYRPLQKAAISFIKALSCGRAEHVVNGGGFQPILMAMDENSCTHEDIVHQMINDNYLYLPSDFDYQDNKSRMLSEKNGRRSAGKRSRALTRYFFITDRVEKGLVIVDNMNYTDTDKDAAGG